MHANFENVLLSRIEILHNYREVAPPSPKDPEIIELAASIEKDGVIQPIMVRPHPSKKDMYQVIFGHRRFLASQLAGKETIPANIRPVDDEQILEIQVTENLQRKDVHPMDEAVAYQKLMLHKKYSVQELAARFSRTPEYITQRLKLNDLVKTLQADFKQDKMLLGHALLLCRLTPADQQKAINYATGHDFRNETVANIKEWIDDEIMQDLTKVPWKLDDANLYPAAGACALCPKRSGAGNLLFTDMAKDNRCFDSNCFEKKQSLAMLVNLKTIVEEQPDIKIVQYNRSSKIAPEVIKYLKDMKVPILHDGSDCHSYSWQKSDVKQKGFYLDGMHKGKVQVIYAKGKASAKTIDGQKTEVAEDPAITIAGIKHRTTRAAELDGEKVHARIVDALENHRSQKEVDSKLKSLPEPEAVALAYILFDELGYSDQQKVATTLKLKKWNSPHTQKDAAEFYSSLRDISVGDLAFIIRKVMLDKHPGTSSNSGKGYIIRKMAESLKDIPVGQYDKEQKDIRDKREQRATDRITALQATVKAKAPKKKTPVKKVPAKKSKAKARPAAAKKKAA